MNIHPYLEATPEVAAALDQGRPVVALESTIVAHGMPYPHNLETARRVEAIVREGGAVPATIAILQGKIRIGLTAEELELLSTAKDVAKVSRRDLAAVLASGGKGATTVAATMIAAALAGIRFFVTGGIGGVHRGYEKTLDVSADLEELARTPVTVICAGAKSILDLPRTLEYLETKGVPVVGLGTRELPAFYTRESGLPLSLSADRPEDVARLIRIQGELGLTGGVLVVNPIPEAYALERDYVETIIEAAQAEADRQGIFGKELTPFLLSRIGQLSGGQSLQANIELVCHNAAVGSAIAVAYQKLKSSN